MTELYNVSFTTKSMIRKFDSKGRVIGQSSMDKPVTITALPHKTAMSYAIADNFKIERYLPDQGRTAKFSSGRDRSVGNGTKRFNNTTAGTRSVEQEKPRSHLNHAAATGNLAAAINA